MLLRYFGFNEDPFGSTPDPRFLYNSYTHREALASLRYGYFSNRGFTALIAPPGMGKTTLLFRMLGEIRETARTVFLFNTQCEPRELMGYILRDLGITPGHDLVETHEQLNSLLISTAEAGKKFVVIIDEAQNLSDEALETVRLLTNFETPRAKLMQIVLSGQPQLSDRLMSPSLMQLRQRISTICRLEPFSAEETGVYIDHRLKLAGYRGAPLFKQDALNLIADASRGIPRTINNLCFNAMSICCAMQRVHIDASMVAEAITDQRLPEPLPDYRPSFSASYPSSSPAAAHPVTPPATAALPRDPESIEHSSAPAKLWARASAVLVALSVLGVLGVSWSHRTVHARSSDVKAVPATSSAPAPANTGTLVGAPAAKVTPFQVIVQPHQTLGDIAVKYLGTYDEERLHQIQTLNPDLTNPNFIHPGQEILLPGPPAVTVAEGTAPPTSIGSSNEP